MDGFNLDIRTLMLVNSLLVASLAFVITYVRFTRRVYPGFSLWVASQWVWAIGFVLLALRGQIPDWISIALANLLICSAYVFLLAGLRAFFGQPEKLRTLEWSLLSIAALFFLWFYLVEESVNTRSLITTLCYLALGILILAFILRQPDWVNSKALVALAGSMGFLFALHLFRLLFMALTSLEVNHLLKDPSIAIPMLLLPISSVFTTFSVILLTYERTEENLVQAEQCSQTLARIDALTGLWNRRHAEVCAEVELARSRREAQPLSVILFDIDHFKAINDCYGHAVGDEVLKQVARVTKAAVREQDIVIRWGGEELLVLLPNCSLKGASELAERLRVALHQIEIMIDGAPPVKVRASFGVTELSTQESFEAMTVRADVALYKAKAEGRDRVVVSDPSTDTRVGTKVSL